MKEKIDEIRGYAADALAYPGRTLVLMAKLARGARRVDGAERPERHGQCSAGHPSSRTTASTPARIMSMMSEQLMPSACEVDITGVLAMYALQLASGTPSALVDWNNNYGR